MNILTWIWCLLVMHITVFFLHQLWQARLAQSVEHETLNLRVVGSSPTLGELFSLFRLPWNYSALIDRKAATISISSIRRHFASTYNNLLNAIGQVLRSIWTILHYFARYMDLFNWKFSWKEKLPPSRIWTSDLEITAMFSRLQSPALPTELSAVRLKCSFR